MRRNRPQKISIRPLPVQEEGVNDIHIFSSGEIPDHMRKSHTTLNRFSADIMEGDATAAGDKAARICIQKR
jgi:hypothetical protein